MGAIVFQEMRESRSLAYMAFTEWINPELPDDNYLFAAIIATQNDKMAQAIDAFDEIINNMPESEAAFKLAKEAVLDQSANLAYDQGRSALEIHRQQRSGRNGRPQQSHLRKGPGHDLRRPQSRPGTVDQGTAIHLLHPRRPERPRPGLACASWARYRS